MKRALTSAVLLVLFGAVLQGPVPVALASPNVTRSTPVPRRTLTLPPLQPLPADRPSVETVLAKMRADLGRLEQYHAVLSCSLMGLDSRTEAWRQDRSLAVTLATNLGDQTLHCRMVFDGTWQHADIREEGMPPSAHTRKPQAVKVGLARTTLPDRPFDTFYELRGAGLVPGEDVPSTILTLARMFRFQLAGVCDYGGEPCFRLDGTGDPEAVKRYYRSIYRPAPTVFMDRSMWMFVSRASGWVRGWGAPTSATDPTPVQLVTLEWKRDRPPGTAFTYTPPKDVTPKDITEAVVLGRAIEALGQLDAIMFLVNRERRLLEAHNPSGETLLHLAGPSGDDSVVSWLLGQGARVNARDCTKATPLMAACRYGNVPVVRALLCYEADVQATDERGETALHAAANAIADGAGATIIPLLLNQDPRVDRKNDQGQTALHCAAAGFAPLSTLQALLNAGASRTAKDNDGKTPYDLATKPEARKLLKP